MAGRIAVGTSSWADRGFVEEWYPPGFPARDRLAWYAERFDAVEVNSTFYALPEARTVQRWVEQTPDGFTAGALADEADMVRMMFNDNRGSDAPKAAQRMRELLESGVPPSRA